jgi:hypothetical protein
MVWHGIIMSDKELEVSQTFLGIKFLYTCHPIKLMVMYRSITSEGDVCRSGEIPVGIERAARDGPDCESSSCTLVLGPYKSDTGRTVTSVLSRPEA